MRDLIVRRCEPGDYEAVHRAYSSPLAMAGTLGMPFSSAREVREELSRERDGSLPLAACVGDEIEATHKRFAYRNGEYVDAHVMARLR